MVERAPDAAAHRIRKPLPGPYALDQTRAEAASQHFIHDFYGKVIRIVSLDPKVGHADIALVHVLFVDEVNPRLRRMNRGRQVFLSGWPLG